jgi:glycerol-3-phosphate acyltransferase PlsY
METLDCVLKVLLILMGYLIGSIPFALVIARVRGVNIRKVGTENPGAANVFRQVGKPYGVLVWTLDTAKGACAMLIADKIFHIHLFYVTLVGIAAVAGHCWSMFLKFKGGKGVATSGGVFLYLLPWAFPIVIAAYFLIQRRPRSILVVTSGFVVSLVLIFLIYRAHWRWLAPALAIFLLVSAIANRSAIVEMRNKRREARERIQKSDDRNQKTDNTKE